MSVAPQPRDGEGLLPLCIVPEWNAPANVRALMTTRRGGVSTGARASLDLGGHASRAPDVLENRRLLRALLPADPHWLHQVHGAHVANLGRDAAAQAWPQADAAITTARNVVCAVRVADCLPVLLADVGGRCVGIAHAGWRGMAGGVIEATVAAMREAGSARQTAWLGPAISRAAFEVGPEVHAAFCSDDPAAEHAFTPGAAPAKWQADLYALARRRLQRAGVTDIAGGGYCTRTQADLFFSYRREHETGRMAALVWIA
ncbi:MAG TPA: peptidoglycan editing factor PgeF [Casimicrobiaceae bacterium]|nr:peptidoglycan editing factor PgeF [Casimicrobiaceae bacterium]